MFIAAQFTAKTQDQHRCSTDDWLKKMWYIYMMEYYSAIKRNEILYATTKWMQLETIILSEVNQIQKDKYYVFSDLW